MEVPVLDIGEFLNDPGGGDIKGRHRELLLEFDRSFTEYGLCHIVGHSCPESVVTNLRKAANDFFTQPSSVKLKSFVDKGYGTAGGYVPCGIEAVGQSTTPNEVDSPALPPDLVEALIFNKLDGSEIYPSTPPELREAVDVYKSHMDELLNALMRIAALSLNLNETFFTKFYDQAMNTLKLAYYPNLANPLAKKSNVGQPRYGAHTDYIRTPFQQSGFTILKQDDVCGGLEALIDNTWIPVPPQESAFTVNAADLISLWTGGRWKSPLHRVAQLPGSSSRLSIVFFTAPGYDVVVDPIDGKNEAVIAGDYLMKKLKAGNRDSRRVPVP